MITNSGNAAVHSGTPPVLDPQTEVLARDLEKIWTKYDSLKKTAEALSLRPGMPPDLIREINQAASDILADSIMDCLKSHMAGPARKPESQPSGPSAAAGGPAGAKETAGGGPETAPPKSKPSRQLSRVEYDKMLAGVCGGVAEYFHIDSSLVRVGFIIAALPTFVFAGLIAYVILAILLPLKLAPEEG